MAESILNELRLLVKKQARLQEQIHHSLIRAEKLIEYPHEEKNSMQAITKALKHLPLEKQNELKEIIEIICRNTEVGIVILFGSYARGDWVEERQEDGVNFKYQSDFDLLVIVSKICSANRQKNIEQDIFKSINDSLNIHTPVSVLVHDINFINSHLEKSQYFFSDIKKEGITLYDSGKFQLEEAVELDNKQRYQLAKDDFEYRKERFQEFHKYYKISFSENDLRTAAFMLHQTTESLYACILLVFTRYKPNTHKLDELRKLTNPLDKRLIKIFPLTTQEEIARFTLLCQAYVEARYNKSYSITKDELIWLSEKVQELTKLTKTLCQEKINSFFDVGDSKNF